MQWIAHSFACGPRIFVLFFFFLFSFVHSMVQFSVVIVCTWFGYFSPGSVSWVCGMHDALEFLMQHFSIFRHFSNTHCWLLLLFSLALLRNATRNEGAYFFFLLSIHYRHRSHHWNTIPVKRLDGTFVRSKAERDLSIVRCNRCPNFRRWFFFRCNTHRYVGT